MQDVVAVYCNPWLPADWSEREARLALERQEELAQRDDGGVEPELLQIYRRAAAI